MILLYTYDDEIEATAAEKAITGKKRLASERDGGDIVYKLFGQASWNNFFALGMYGLRELKDMVAQQNAGQSYDYSSHDEIITSLKRAARTYDLEIPKHWLRNK